METEKKGDFVCGSSVAVPFTFAVRKEGTLVPCADSVGLVYQFDPAVLHFWNFARAMNGVPNGYHPISRPSSVSAT